MKRRSAAGLPFDRANLLEEAVAPGLFGIFQQWKPFQRWPSRLYNFHFGLPFGIRSDRFLAAAPMHDGRWRGHLALFDHSRRMAGTENSSPGFQTGTQTLRTLEGCGKQLFFSLLPICIAALRGVLQAAGCGKEALTTPELGFMLLTCETLPCSSAF